MDLTTYWQGSRELQRKNKLFSPCNPEILIIQGEAYLASLDLSCLWEDWKSSWMMWLYFGIITSTVSEKFKQSK